MSLPFDWRDMKPVYATKNAAAADLRAAKDMTIAAGRWEVVPTGFTGDLLFADQPENVCALVLPRSGLASKRGITVLNSPGLIDRDYQGEVKVILINHGLDPFEIKQGDRIAQLLMVKRHWHLGLEYSDNEREGGFGSSGME